LLRNLGRFITVWTSSSPLHSAVWRYGGTVVVMLSVIALCTISFLQDYAFLIVMAAVLACSWFGGVGPSLLAPLLLVMSIRIVQRDAGRVFDFSTTELIELIVFLLLTAAVGWSGQVRRRAQEMSSKQAMQLLEEAHRKDRFLATLAHELRNPLAPLRTGLELLQIADEGSGDRTVIREVRELMQRQVNQLVRLIDDLLDVSRINTGKIELRREHVELTAIIRDAVEASQPHLRASDQELDCAIEDTRLMLECDPARISQVLLNILNNASKFSPGKGRIQLLAGREGNFAEIRIRDNGMGIPRSMLPHIFDMFTQVDGSLTRSHGGLGIGLSISRTLVQMHGGTVTANSDGVNCGSEFVIRLPLSSEPADREPSQSSPATQNHSMLSRRVLIADDNQDAARSLAMLLARTGHECRLAFGGPQALQMAADYQPEVVVLDIGMPDMDGYEIARRMRALPDGVRLLLIAVTGWGQDDDRRRSFEAGFNYHLVKPVDVEALHVLIASR
jgi:signal transduction histidine kinase